MKRIYKILIATTVAFVLILGVFALAEEISAFKRSAIAHIKELLRTETVTETETETETVTETESQEVPLEELYASFPPFTHSEDAWYINNRLIYHAGGAVEGITYTNSREAVEGSLAVGNILEIDFFYTSDHQLVCIHSWEYITESEIPMTAKEYRSYKIYGKYTTMDAKDIVSLMEEREDLYIIVDTKEEDIVPVVQNLLDLAGNRSEIIDRFVFQIYEQGAKAQLMNVYPFTEENIIYSCYKHGAEPDQILRLCMEEGISMVAVVHDYWSADVIAMFAQKGILVFEHTINRPDILKNALERGVYGIYTDFITSIDD